VYGLLLVALEKDIDPEIRTVFDEISKEIAFTLYAINLKKKRERVEEKLKESLKEKELLLREVHHRTKNNLQTISSLLSLQVSNTDNRQAIRVMQESQNRIKSMSLVHEKLYRYGDLSKIDIREYMETLAHELFGLYGVNSNNVKLMIKIKDIRFGIDTAIPCGLIANEILSNSLKYAFPENKKGKILIELKKNKGKFFFSIMDDGVGLPKEVDLKNTKTLGLQLINTLTDQLGGNIKLDSRNGTQFMITFTETKKR